MNLITYLRTLLGKDEGQDLLEYALLVALIALICVGVVGTAGTSVQNIFSQINAGLFGGGATP
jgi:Flp pilus assembly pilin Flp